MRTIFLWLLLLCTAQTGRTQIITRDLQPNSFTVLPLDTAAIAGMIPLGNMNPAGHTFPTPYTYQYYKPASKTWTIHSPGNLRLFRVVRMKANIGTPKANTFYSLYFGYPFSVLYIGHVQTLSQKISSLLNFANAQCESYSITGEGSFEYCRLDNLVIPLSAGEVAGTAGYSEQNLALDLGVFINEKGQCPIDYFADSLKAKLMPLLGNYNGTIKRTIPPVCGEYNYFVRGTIRGNWVQDGQSVNDEEHHIAFAKDNVEPNIPVISIGDAFPGFPYGRYGFTAQAAGVIDRPFTDVNKTGQLFCYNLRAFKGGLLSPAQSLLLQMEDGVALTAEQKNCDCNCALAQGFSTAKRIFRR
jgi:hypothetical protein